MSQQNKRRARIAIIGAGWWSTQAHLPSLREYPLAEVVGIADLSPERLRAAGDAYGVQQQYSDYRQMLDVEQPDGVIVAVNHVAHYEVAKEVLERKLGLLLEKPMVLRAREARTLKRLADENGVPMVIGYPWHFVPQNQQLRDIIASGRLGRIQLASGLFASMVIEFLRGRPQAYASIFNYPVTGPTPSTYSEPGIAGGGQGHLQVTHSAALLFWLTGLKPVKVSAFMERFDLKVDLCDAITVRFDNDAIGTIASTGNIALAHSGNQRLDYRIFGTEGYVMLDVLDGTCTIYSNDGTVQRLDPTPPDRRYPQEATARHLVDLLLGRATVNISPAEFGVRTVELLEAAYRSAGEGRMIRVDEL
jgi:predicted dehydrogenase